MGIVFRNNSLRAPVNSANLGNWQKSKKHCKRSQNALCSFKFSVKMNSALPAHNHNAPFALNELIGKKKKKDKNKEESRSSMELSQLVRKKTRGGHGKIAKINDLLQVSNHRLW